MDCPVTVDEVLEGVHIGAPTLDEMWKGPLQLARNHRATTQREEKRHDP